MTYILGSVEVQVPERSRRPREAAQPSPHDTVNSPLMATRLLRPRNSGNGVSAPLADRFLGKVVAHKGQQAKLEKLLAAMVAELKPVAEAAAFGADGVTRSTFALRRVALEKAIDACMKEIQACAAQANNAALDAVKSGASQKEVIAAAESVSASSGSTPVVESSTASVDVLGRVAVGPGATISPEPVLTETLPVVAAPGANPAVNAAVNAVADAEASGLSLGKVALGVGAAWLVWRAVKSSKSA